MLATQRALIGVIRRFVESVQSVPRASWTSGQAQARLGLLSSYWTDFLANHVELVTDSANLPPDAYPASCYHDTEAAYLEAMGFLYDVQTQLNPMEPGPSNRRDSAGPSIGSTGSSNSRLPRIDIPVFSGRREDWESFRDLFGALVHRDDQLSDVEKLYYLKAHVRGDASAALDSLQITASSYATAWGLLEERYEHRRLLVSDHITALFNLPHLTRESASGLQSLLDTIERHRDQLQALGRPVDHWDDWFVIRAACCMDSITRREWEIETERLGKDSESSREVLSTYQNLTDFIRRRCRSLATFEGIHPEPHQSQSRNNKSSSSSKYGSVKALVSQSPACAHCGGSHYLGRCEQFVKLDLSSRRALVTRLRLYFNCLRPNHMVRNCPSNSTCSTCQKDHHSLLHEPSRKRSILLPTAQIQVSGNHHRAIAARALLDSCSEITIASAALVRRLSVPVDQRITYISGLGGEIVGRTTCKATIHLNTLESGVTTELDVHCVRTLGLTVPSIKASPSVVKEWSDLTLADAHLGDPAPVDLVIGADQLHKLLKPGLIQRNSMMAQLTLAGWALSGRASSNTQQDLHGSCSTLLTNVEPVWHRELLESLQRFWETEEVPHASRSSPDDALCEQIFADHRRDDQGRYIVRLPLRPGSAALLGTSLPSAQASLRSVQRRMLKDDAFAAEYRKFMTDYINLGHMRPLSPGEIRATSQPVHYIPHHGIWQRGDSGPKLRVVFDASRPTSTGHSLNDVVFTGPSLQPSLWRVLLKWRRHRIAFCTDVKMMVTYGQSCAPYLALRTLQQLCSDEGHHHPEAATVLLSERYVDDVLSGADDLHHAAFLRDQLISLANRGGFPLRKWVENSPELLDDLPSDVCLRPTWIHLSTGGPITELGVCWDPTSDSFRLTPPSVNGMQETKREILSAMASLFDPCGWLAPIVLTAKLVMQDLWRCRIGWDESSSFNSNPLGEFHEGTG
uniref:Peptidase aspartic putative domain-containing protein n=1 Tax=Trichogramma kaykai TaxID=54128 RepID=A0ABD2X9Y3_9HYME